MMSKIVRKSLLLAVGALIGLLIVHQFNGYREVSRVNARDRNTNAFREIKVLQEGNRELTNEIAMLEQKLADYSDQAERMKALQEDIHRHELIAGAVPVAGPGLALHVDRAVEVIWLIDIVNELLGAGAEAVAVNAIRLTPTTRGFSTVGDEITLGGHTITVPFTVTAIGDPDTLKKALELPGGILKRLQAAYPSATIQARPEAEIVMPASG